MAYIYKTILRYCPKELFLYYLTTEGRQMQMLEWIMENAAAFAISVT